MTLSLIDKYSALSELLGLYQVQPTGAAVSQTPTSQAQDVSNGDRGGGGEAEERRQPGHHQNPQRATRE